MAGLVLVINHEQNRAARHKHHRRVLRSTTSRELASIDLHKIGGKVGRRQLQIETNNPSGTNWIEKEQFDGKGHRSTGPRSRRRRSTWLMKQFDADGDGRISRRELRPGGRPIRRRGACVVHRRQGVARRVVCRADRDHDDEMRRASSRSPRRSWGVHTRPASLVHASSTLSTE
jgi:hypothetical protein